MIVRPRLHWFRMLFVWQGSVLRRILPQLGVTTAFAAAVVLTQGRWPQWVPNLTPVPFTLLGIALAIFLGFRNTVSYDRYWEARKLWGAILNDSRSLARQVITLSDADSDTRRRVVHLLIAYVHALRHQLRGSEAGDELHRWLPSTTWPRVDTARYKPAIVLLLIADELRQLRTHGQLHPMLATAMDTHLGKLNESLGGCERIASTPIPFAYSVILHRTAYLYSFLLPFGLVETLHAATPLIVAFVSYTFFALEALAEEIQEPFGLEPNDLALDAMSAMIAATLLESLGDVLPVEAKQNSYTVT